MAMNEAYIEFKIPKFVEIQIKELLKAIKLVCKSNDYTNLDFNDLPIQVVQLQSLKTRSPINILNIKIYLQAHTNYTITVRSCYSKGTEFGLLFTAEDALTNNIFKSFTFQYDGHLNHCLPITQINHYEDKQMDVLKEIYKNFSISFGVIHHDISAVVWEDNLPSQQYILYSKELYCFFHSEDYYVQEEQRLLQQRKDKAIPTAKTVVHPADTRTSTTHINDEVVAPAPTFQSSASVDEELNQLADT